MSSDDAPIKQDPFMLGATDETLGEQASVEERLMERIAEFEGKVEAL